MNASEDLLNNCEFTLQQGKGVIFIAYGLPRDPFNSIVFDSPHFLVLDR